MPMFSWAVGAEITFSLLALGLGAWLFWRMRRSSLPEPVQEEAAAPRSPEGVADVLGTVLNRTNVPESDGVRWDVAIYPGAVSAPGYVVLTAIFQNAYDHPRTARLEVAPDSLLPHGHAEVIALQPGEAGILRAPLFVSRALAPGEYALRATLSARAPRGEGDRMLPEPRRRDSAPRAVSLRITAPHEGAPVNLFAYEWKGFVSLYIPPQTAPDLTELRVLQELASVPIEE